MKDHRTTEDLIIKTDIRTDPAADKDRLAEILDVHQSTRSSRSPAVLPLRLAAAVVLIACLALFCAFREKPIRLDARCESCGECVPCRMGTKRMLEILTRITEGEGREGDIELLEELSGGIKDAKQTIPFGTVPLIQKITRES